MARFRVRLFASHREAAGKASAEVDLADGATVADLRRALAQALPALASVELPGVFAVNGSFAPDSARIRPGDDVALFPPVSGG